MDTATIFIDEILKPLEYITSGQKISETQLEEMRVQKDAGFMKLGSIRYGSEEAALGVLADRLTSSVGKEQNIAYQQGLSKKPLSQEMGKKKH